MTWGRKKSGGRKEPLFGLAASLSELRLSPQDRVTPADDDKPAKKIPKRKAADPDEDAPRERKPRVSRGGSKRKGRARGGIARLFYWGAVLGLWAAIAIVGVVVDAHDADADVRSAHDGFIAIGGFVKCEHVSPPYKIFVLCIEV